MQRYRKFQIKHRKPRDQYWVDGQGGFWWNGHNWYNQTKGNYWSWGPGRDRSMCSTAWVDTEKELMDCVSKLRIARMKVSQTQTLTATQVRYKIRSGIIRRQTVGTVTFRGI